MPEESIMKKAMQRYIDGFNQKDAKALISLFANNAKIEDPVGGGKIVEGIEAITAFYELAVTLVDKLELAAPIRGSHSNAAAMAFTIFMKDEGQTIRINCIDVMTFNESGKIIDMKAYHGPSDVMEQ
ncbi:nuclear transport factor 2 family protein [Virgibacillus sp. W0181]|uniref:nuclear transport factor 2 family protein n=1 Tax=Virgibacillus sp. W0181 TaxID=3391581 RepID=UPI003F45173E